MAISNRPFQIDGVTIPNPTTYKFSIEDLSSEETGRTLDGVMHKDIIDDKDVYECTWKNLSWEDTATLLNAINKKTQISFTYVDPRVPNQTLTNNFYVGKRGGAALNLRNDGNTWDDITFSFIRI